MHSMGNRFPFIPGMTWVVKAKYFAIVSQTDAFIDSHSTGCSVFRSAPAVLLKPTSFIMLFISEINPAFTPSLRHP